MFDSSWINNETGVKGSLVTAEVRGLLDKQFTEGISSALLRRGQKLKKIIPGLGFGQSVGARMFSLIKFYLKEKSTDQHDDGKIQNHFDKFSLERVEPT